MIGRLATFSALSVILAAVAVYVTFAVSTGDCGMGPDATSACYARQQPWAIATLAAFVLADLLLAYMIFSRRRRGGKDS